MSTATETTIPHITFKDESLIPIWAKVQSEERLSFEDGLTCLNTNDIISLGQMADYVKRKLWGDKVYFVFNRHINPTNICVLSCTFCDFAKKRAMKMHMRWVWKRSWENSTQKCTRSISSEGTILTGHSRGKKIS